MRRLLLGLNLLVLAASVAPAGLLAPRCASAQDAGDARTRARAAYTEGQRLFEAGDFAGALAKFEEAYALVNNPVVLLGVASAEERLGRLPEARTTLERYLRERADAPDRADVERRIAALPTPPTTASAPAAGEPAAAAPTTAAPEPAATAPAATTSAAPDARETVDAAEAEAGGAAGDGAAGDGTAGDGTAGDGAAGDGAAGDGAAGDGAAGDGAAGDGAAGDGAAEAEAPEEEAAPASDDPTAGPDPSAATWVMTSVAGVSLVAGTVFGFLALSRQSDFDVLPSRTLADEGEAFALAADLAFGVATAAGITAIVLYAVDRPVLPAAPALEADEADDEADGETETTEGEASASIDLRVMPLVGPTGGGAAMSMNF